MWKKILPNYLYTLGIVICLIVGYQDGIEKGNYLIAGLAILILAIFIVLKIRFLKDINKTLKKP
jgi:Family of unknown function (DUF6358)